MALVQKLEFIVRRKHLEQVLSNSKNVALRITLGVNANASLVISADGVTTLENFEPVVESIPICPVPPDCAPEDNG